MAQVVVQPVTSTKLSWDSAIQEDPAQLAEQAHGLVSRPSTNTSVEEHVQIHKSSKLQELFAENVFAKLFRVASRDLQNNNPPTAYPEYVPQEEVLGEIGRYCLRESAFWTCGFFPGTLYTFLDRCMRYPGSIPKSIPSQLLHSDLESLCKSWSEPLHTMASRTDTHDLGFIIEPALRLDWEITGNTRSLQSIIQAAKSLASRYNKNTNAIRSWDLINKKDIQINGMEDNFIVIIDSLCNLELLFYASARSKNAELAEIATKHAKTLLLTHLRPENVGTIRRNGYNGQLYSTYHVANLDPQTGTVKAQMTAQGYADTSTWSRGQSWAILGYAQTYHWTKDVVFLDAAMGCAEYYLHKLAKQQELDKGYKLPLWDFEAPIENFRPVWDSSSGVIAANGMLLLSQACLTKGDVSLSKYFRDASITLVETILEFSLAEEKARFVLLPNGIAEVEDVHENRLFDAILKNSTANNNAGSRKRYSNHGLVYADYYLVMFGNKLLDMGIL